MSHRCILFIYWSLSWTCILDCCNTQYSSSKMFFFYFYKWLISDFIPKKSKFSKKFLIYLESKMNSKNIFLFRAVLNFREIPKTKSSNFFLVLKFSNGSSRKLYAARKQEKYFSSSFSILNSLIKNLSNILIFRISQE